MDFKIDFDDIVIVPNVLTDIRSRKNVDPYDNDGYLPLFTAPMSSVVNSNNAQIFTSDDIHVVLPRTEKYKFNQHYFNAFSLIEFEEEFLTKKYEGGDIKVLIDIANGHMEDIISLSKKAKVRYPKANHKSKLTIMAGNVASPQTYEQYCKSDVIDYVRLGIGNGNGCLTTQQTGIGYPMASLIIECNQIKKQFDNPTKIVADGGMKKYADIIKALALGADYVMIGSLFNKALESASPNYWYNLKLPNGLAEYLYEKGYNIHKEFYGMSTKKAQKEMGNNELKTSEGVIRKQKVEYTLNQWKHNFESYLRSAMSYTNSHNLAEFVGSVDYVAITENSFLRYNK
jgi:IMP dehydrogenase/GMP reductase